jgi:hypothetical protein
MGHVRQSYRFSSIAPVPRPRARATSQGPPRPHTSAHFLRPDVLFPRFQGRRIVRTRLSSHADAFATPIRPDAAFSRRLKKFADACESQQIACRYATRGDPGWEPTLRCHTPGATRTRARQRPLRSEGAVEALRPGAGGTQHSPSGQQPSRDRPRPRRASHHLARVVRRCRRTRRRRGVTSR